jgi:chromosome segregation ATPase
VVLPVVGLAAIAVTARQPSQDTSQQPAEDPVAEAARKAREHKKEAPKPKKVYTNDDLSSARAPAPAPTAAVAKKDDATKSSEAGGNAEAAPDAAKAEKNADKNGDRNSEAAWRKRFKEAREKLAEAEKELDILQREVNKAQTQYYTDPQKALSEQYTRKDINEHDTKIEAKKQEVAQLKQQISDLEDELRKSGGDIGWSRE